MATESSAIKTRIIWLSSWKPFASAIVSPLALQAILRLTDLKKTRGGYPHQPLGGWMGRRVRSNSPRTRLMISMVWVIAPVVELRALQKTLKWPREVLRGPKTGRRWRLRANRPPVGLVVLVVSVPVGPYLGSRCERG